MLIILITTDCDKFVRACRIHTASRIPLVSRRVRLIGGVFIFVKGLSTIDDDRVAVRE